ncbi:TPA: ATP-binding cassette domain-containing protein [Escherichia coli]|nr:ATP-binding cassette domain-containing protein [Escherichia coli]
MFTATEAVPVAKVVAGNKRYPGVVALDNVNFTLNKGEVRALLGKNGAGKSTLIRMLTGSERPDSGDIWIGETRLEGDEATLTRRAAELGVRAVYQELSLVEGLTVAENLCLGQWPRRNGMIDYLQMAQDAQRCLQALGVDVSPEQLVSTLSPAQKQLVEIARVMKGEPRVVILDEPTSSLASAEVELVISAVKKMSALGVAVIYVSHRMEEIRRIASCATVMRDGQVAGDVMLENTSTHHIVSLMLGRDHVDIAPVAPQEIVDQAVLEVRALRHKPKLEDISFTLRRGEVSGSDNVLVVGLGPVGMMAMMLAKGRGAKRIIGVDMLPERLAMAKQLGVMDHGYLATTEGLPQIIAELTHGGADVALDCSGNAAGRLLALRSTADWGRVVYIGETGKVEFEVSADLMHHQRRIIGSWVTSLFHMEKCAHDLTDWKLWPRNAITHRFSLEQAGDAYALMASGKCGKVVINFPD